MTIQNDALITSWQDVDRMIKGLAYRVARRRRLSYEDVYQTCLLWFVEKVYPTYDPERGVKFSTWVQWKLSRLLCGYETGRWTENADEGDLNGVPEKEAGLMAGVISSMSELSEDARLVLHLVLELPQDVRDALRDHMRVRKNDDDPEPQKVSWAVWRVLRDIQWTTSRIAESFREIAEVIWS